ncbi:MAG TPA: hypothetical protein VKI19_00120 [Acidimicrobiales bacterium]|nr:hypothetical protein [Acidimicrobiales bacterium]
MPSDEELRKVAEDVRALARSLARDIWDATNAARGSGRPPTQAFKHGVRDAAYGARREFQRGMRHHWCGWGPPPPGRPGGPPGPGRPQPGPEDVTTSGPGWDRSRPSGWSGPWPGFQQWGPPARARHTGGHRKGPFPPLRRRWEASVLASLLVVMFGIAWLIGGLGAVHLSTEAVLAAGLMLLGAALVVTARTDWSLSRHAWPVLVGAVLIVGLFATSSSFGVNGALANMSIGSTSPIVPAHGGNFYGGFGRLNVDAGQVLPGSTVRVESLAGETFITVPANAVIHGKVLTGQICIAGGPVSDGVGATLNASLGVTSPDTVDVEIHQLAGEVVINGQGCTHR